MSDITRCRSCGAPIVFLRTGRTKPDGRPVRMPVDAATVTVGDQIFDAERHVDHWSTCDNPTRFRPGAGKRAESVGRQIALPI